VLSAYERESGFFTPVAMTLKKVSPIATSSLDNLLTDLEEWSKNKERQTTEFYKAFGSNMLRRNTDSDVSFLKRKTRLSRSDLEWDTADWLTHATMYLIPVVNLAYAIVSNDVHKDQLAKRLDEVRGQIMGLAEAGLMLG
jgi:hypothetical protein